MQQRRRGARTSGDELGVALDPSPPDSKATLLRAATAVDDRGVGIAAEGRGVAMAADDRGVAIAAALRGVTSDARSATVVRVS